MSDIGRDAKTTGRKGREGFAKDAKEDKNLKLMPIDSWFKDIFLVSFRVLREPFASSASRTRSRISL
jgi:hypothetical protein